MLNSRKCSSPKMEAFMSLQIPWLRRKLGIVMLSHPEHHLWVYSQRLSGIGLLTKLTLILHGKKYGLRYIRTRAPR